MEPIFQFLEGRRTSDKPTHLSMIHPLGKFYIQGKDHEDFMNLYCSQSTDDKFGLLEATSNLPLLPVLVDADVKKELDERPVSLDDLSPLYKSDLILRLVRIYQEVLKTILKEVAENDLLCIVLTKPPYFLENEKTGKFYIKNGFHLQFPRCLVSKHAQMNELIPRVKLLWKKEVSIQEYNISIDQIIDKSYCRGTPWLMYRSCKASTMDPYLVSYVVDGEGLVQENWRPMLMDMQMLRHDRSKIELDFTNIDYFLPRILSVSPLGKEHYIYDLREDLEPLPSTNAPTSLLLRQPQKLNTRSKTECSNNMSELVKDLLEILNDQRAEERNEWIMVGWMLYNIFEGKEEGLNLWIDFSRRSPSNFNLPVCRNEWSKMVPRDVTIGTLKFMAKTDNPKAYNSVIAKYMQFYYEKAMKLNGSHNDLAKALFEKYEHQFVCASIKEKLWYEYKDHCWNQVDDGYTLRKKISEEIVKSYEQLMQDLTAKCAQADEDEQPLVNKKLKNCIRLVSCLKQAPYKSNIMKECMEVFYQPTFLKDMDSQAYLFAFSNGIYDIASHKFRDGRPSDLNSIKAPIRYRHDLSMDHKEVQDVLDFFAKIFPDKDVMQYFFDVSAQVFIGGNHAKIVQVWTGEGDNGKSVTQSLFEKMLGSYAIKLPTSLIVGKRTQSSAACPELVRAGNGVRMAVLQEPDAKDTINVGILKELSGNDSFFARGLYKGGSEITPMFKLIMICNDPPELPHNDKAAWNRIRVIPFDSRFTNDAPTDPDQQLKTKNFPKDTTLGDRIGTMAEAFAWFLIEHLKKHPKIRAEPYAVISATDKYKNSNDLFRLFAGQKIVKSENPDSSFGLMDGWELFGDWMKLGFKNDKRVFNVEDFKKGMNRLYGEGVEIQGLSRWYGYYLRKEIQSQDADNDRNRPILTEQQQTSFQEDNDEKEEFVDESQCED